MPEPLRTKPHAFDAEAIGLARTFASCTAIALANAHLYSSGAAVAAQRSRRWNRALIDRAIGITMLNDRCDPLEAFNALRASQAADRKRREVAKAVVGAATRDAAVNDRVRSEQPGVAQTVAAAPRR